MKNREMTEVGLLPNGCMLYRQKNKAGGYTYYSDEVGCGVIVWDTCGVDEDTLLTAILAEHTREREERRRGRS